MDFFTIFVFILLNAFIITSGFAFFTALGNYWVRRPAPHWLTGAGLYCHRFLDGLEYSLTRTALVAGMARNILVLKCVPIPKAAAGFKSGLLRGPSSNEPVASPPVPDLLRQVFTEALSNKSVQPPAPTPVSAPPQADQETVVVQDGPVVSVAAEPATPIVATPTATTTSKKRSRSRIAPPASTCFPASSTAAIQLVGAVGGDS